MELGFVIACFCQTGNIHAYWMKTLASLYHTRGGTQTIFMMALEIFMYSHLSH